MKNLDDLFELMVNDDESVLDAYGMWDSSVPTFGGSAPDNTTGVWSWDTDRLLVGTCNDDLEIINREDWQSKMTNLTSKKLKKFGPRARGILIAASLSPQNPWDYFGTSLRRSWGYAYFARLHHAGLLRRVDTPKGRQGYHWYVTT